MCPWCPSPVLPTVCSFFASDIPFQGGVDCPPNTHTHHSSSSCIDCFLVLRLSNWLLPGWGLLGYDEKVCITRRLAETRPRGPPVSPLSFHVTTETDFRWNVSWCVQPPWAAVNTDRQWYYIVLLLRPYKEDYSGRLWLWVILTTAVILQLKQVF